MTTNDLPIPEMIGELIEFHKRCHIYVQDYYGGDVNLNADTITCLRELQRVRENCTGRHGSQSYCGNDSAP